MVIKEQTAGLQIVTHWHPSDPGQCCKTQKEVHQRIVLGI